jgi:epoxyqueuosine reductase
VTMLSDSEFTSTVVEKAKTLGASVAGVADVGTLKKSPSHRIYPKIGMDPEVRWQDAPEEALQHEVDWPADWYDGKGTPGNRILIRIVKELSLWLEETLQIKSHRPPYFIESTGIFLKDAAAMAGLGRIGKNNLVITREYGPRIRWRALLLDRSAKATGPLDFDPCDGCEQPCRKACPVGAFDNTVYSSSELEQSILPGVNGTYDRVTCNTKMARDVEEAARAMAASDEEGEALASTMNAFEEVVMTMPKGDGEPQYGVKYCRRCELSCPVGGRYGG